MAGMEEGPVTPGDLEEVVERAIPLYELFDDASQRERHLHEGALVCEKLETWFQEHGHDHAGMRIHPSVPIGWLHEARKLFRAEHPNLDLYFVDGDEPAVRILRTS